MATHNVFDVILVYNSASAKSASTTSKSITSPFKSKPSYDKAYGYFLKVCLAYNLRAALSTSSDIIGPGKFKSYWTYADKIWTKHNKRCNTKQVFAKFSPTSDKGKALRKLLFSSNTVKSFNNTKLFEMFFDKQKTYNSLPLHSIPTISLPSSSQRDVKQTCRILTGVMEDHPHRGDFSDSIIMKDRFGAGGRNIYKFQSTDTASIAETANNNPTLSFIIQPFAKFDKGYTFNQCVAATDIRLIYLNGEIISCYLRTAKVGDFRCNQHQGGSLQYLPISEIPDIIRQKGNQITSTLDKKSSLYTLDFIISNSGNPYFLEGNTGPGLDWDPNDETDKLESKKLISLIVSELSDRVIANRSN